MYENKLRKDTIDLDKHTLKFSRKCICLTFSVGLVRERRRT